MNIMKSSQLSTRQDCPKILKFVGPIDTYRCFFQKALYLHYCFVQDALKILGTDFVSDPY